MAHRRHTLRLGARQVWRRRLRRFGDGKAYEIKASLKTWSPKRAAVLGPLLSAYSEALLMKMEKGFVSDGLTAAQRAEIYRRQILAERDRLERMHAHVQLDEPDDAEAVLHGLLEAGEAANRAFLLTGEGRQFTNPDYFRRHFAGLSNIAWDAVFAQMWEYPHPREFSDEAAAGHLEALEMAGTPLNLQMARRVVHEAKLAAIQEYRQKLAEPVAAYPIVPPEGFGLIEPQHTVMASKGTLPPPATIHGVAPAGPYATMKPAAAGVAFLKANPRTGGVDGAARAKSKTWDAKTREQFLLAALLLEQVMGDRPLCSVTDDDLLGLDGLFNRLHGASFRKSPRHRTMTIQDIVAETALKVEKRELLESQLGLGIPTTNRHYGFLRQLIDWLRRKTPVADLDWKAVIAADDRDARTARDAYTVEEGRIVFSLPIWTGCRSKERRLEPGSAIIHDAGYWVLLIAWYTGLRREEICALELADIVVEADSHWHFDIRDTETGGLKNVSSRRLVPMAKELVRLGLPAYVEGLRNAGETILFPELRSERQGTKLGDLYYKRWWRRIAKNLDFLERGQAVHSFRHMVTNELKEQEVFLEQRADLVGHRHKGETAGRYSKAASLVRLRSVVEKIPNVTAHLDPQPLRLLPKKGRQPRPERKRAD